MDNTTEPPAKRQKPSDSEEMDATTTTTDSSTHAILSRINEAVTLMSANQERLLADNATLINQVNLLTKEVDELKKSLAQANDMLTTIDQGQQRSNGGFRESNHQNSAARTRNPAMPLPTAMNAAAVPSAATTADDDETLPALPAMTDDQLPKRTPVRSSQKNPNDEKLSDNNLYLIDVLLNLRDIGCINVDHISKSNYPKDLVRCSGNTCYIRYCLELVEFVATSNEELTDCIRSLADESIDNEEVIRNVVEILVNACSEKIEELDGKKVRKKTVIGLGSRVRDYKKKIAKTRLGNHYSAEHVALVEREELDQIKSGGGEEEGVDPLKSEEGVEEKSDDEIKSDVL